MEQNLKYFFEKLNETEIGTKFMILLISALVFFGDIYLNDIAHIWHVPTVFRCLYGGVAFVCFMFSLTFFIDGILKSLRYAREKRKAEKNLMDTFHKFPENEFMLLHKMASCGSVCIPLENEKEINAAKTLSEYFDFINLSNNQISIEKEKSDILVKAFFAPRKYKK